MADFALPETQHAQSGDFSIAYQVMGDGPIDVVMVPGLLSHIDFQHELPGYTHFVRRMSRFSRVVTFDKRGQGLSDRLADVPSLEERMDDIRAVMDAVGSKRAALVGFSEGASMSVLFATAYPERVSRLVLFGAVARVADLLRSDLSPATYEELLTKRIQHRGAGAFLKNVFSQRCRQSGCSCPPRQIRKAGKHPRRHQILYAFEPADRHQSHSPGGPHDHRWRDLLDRHDDLSGRIISKHRGTLVKSTGDGVLATFDGPGRAVRCVLALSEETRSIGLPIRSGLHCGEVEVRGSDIGGIAVHAAARVMAQSGSAEVLVSRVVTDLVTGTDLKFSQRGSFELKGLAGKWELFAASK